jgi:hypothetical protein
MSSPSAKNRTLGEAFPECRPSTRGRFNTVGDVHFSFMKNPLPRVQHLGKNFVIFLQKASSPSAYSRHSGKEEIKKQKKKKLQLVFFLHTQ